MLPHKSLKQKADICNSYIVKFCLERRLSYTHKSDYKLELELQKLGFY